MARSVGDWFKKGQAGAASAVSLAVFGKHPGWRDHVGPRSASREGDIALLGWTSERLGQLKDSLYDQGIEKNIGSGSWTTKAEAANLDKAVGYRIQHAWTLQDESERLAYYAHTILWKFADGLVIGRLWASRDAAYPPRRDFPMAAVVELGRVPVGFAVRTVVPVLRDLERDLTRIEDADGALQAVERRRSELKALLAQAPEAGAADDTGLDRAAAEQMLERAGFGPARAGADRAAGAARERLGLGDSSRRSSSSSAPVAVRVPGVVGDEVASLLAWDGLVSVGGLKASPVVLVCRHDQGLVDIVAGSPGVNEWGVLRWSTARVPVTEADPSVGRSLVDQWLNHLPAASKPPFVLEVAGATNAAPVAGAPSAPSSSNVVSAAAISQASADERSADAKAEARAEAAALASALAREAPRPATPPATPATPAASAAAPTLQSSTPAADVAPATVANLSATPASTSGVTDTPPAPAATVSPAAADITPPSAPAPQPSAPPAEVAASPTASSPSVAPLETNAATSAPAAVREPAPVPPAASAPTSAASPAPSAPSAAPKPAPAATTSAPASPSPAPDAPKPVAEPVPQPMPDVPLKAPPSPSTVAAAPVPSSRETPSPASTASGKRSSPLMGIVIGGVALAVIAGGVFMLTRSGSKPTPQPVPAVPTDPGTSTPTTPGESNSRSTPPPSDRSPATTASPASSVASTSSGPASAAPTVNASASGSTAPAPAPAPAPATKPAPTPASASAREFAPKPAPITTTSSSAAPTAPLSPTWTALDALASDAPAEIGPVRDALVRARTLAELARQDPAAASEAARVARDTEGFAEDFVRARGARDKAGTSELDRARADGLGKDAAELIVSRVAPRQLASITDSFAGPDAAKSELASRARAAQASIAQSPDRLPVVVAELSQQRARLDRLSDAYRAERSEIDRSDVPTAAKAALASLLDDQAAPLWREASGDPAAAAATIATEGARRRTCARAVREGESALAAGEEAQSVRELLTRLAECSASRVAGVETVRASLERVLDAERSACASPEQRLAAIERAPLAEARAAWRGLTGCADWPRTMVQLQQLAQAAGRVRALPALATSTPEIDAFKNELNTGLVAAWAGALSRAAKAGDQALCGSIIEGADDLKIDLAKAPSWAKYNRDVVLARKRLVAASDDEASAVAAQLTGAHRALEPVAGVLGELASASTRRGAPLGSLGPGAAGWTGQIKEDGRVLVFTSTDAGEGEPVVLTFRKLDGVGPSAVYLQTDETSIGAFARVLSAQKDSAKRKPMLAGLWSGRGVLAVGVRSWEWDESRTQIRVSTGGPADLGGWVKDIRIRVDPAMVAPAPSAASPMQAVSAASALAFARAVGCRLPTPEEWKAARDATPSAASSANIRDAAFGRVWNADTSSSRARDLLADVFNAQDVPAGGTPPVDARDDQTAIFRDTNPTSGEFLNLEGNVAEWVLPGQSDSTAGARVIGGSALSAPSASRTDAAPLAPGGRAWFSDVGIRLAFDAAGAAEPAGQLATRVREVLQRAPLLAGE